MGDHAEDRQNDDIHFRMSEVPTQMLHGMYTTKERVCQQAVQHRHRHWSCGHYSSVTLALVLAVQALLVLVPHY